jgi:transposase-like protein
MPEKIRSARRSYDDGFKAKVALEAIRETAPLNELASKYGVHPNQISQWKKTFLENAPSLFGRKTSDGQELERLRHENQRLIHQIGELAVDNDFLKKTAKRLNLL